MTLTKPALNFLSGAGWGEDGTRKRTHELKLELNFIFHKRPGFLDFRTECSGCFGQSRISRQLCICPFLFTLNHHLFTADLVASETPSN